MLRTALWTLRQPRYSALALLMLLVALGCCGAGTWQVFRYQHKVHENQVLTDNAHARTVPLSTDLVPLVGTGPAPDRYAIDYRAVTVTGTYLDRPAEYLRNQKLNGTNGYYALSPLRTDDGVLLVARGFTGNRGDTTVPAPAPAPPSGTVHLTGRLHPTDTNSDAAAALPDHELESINAAEQSRRLGTPVYTGYLTLEAHQPGTAGLTALPAPDLSNPAGGAYSWQNLAYVVQWYVFALLALAAPFVVCRSEIREARRRYLGVSDDQFDAAELDDEHGGRPELTAAATEGDLVLRSRGDLATREQEATARWERAVRLADRYGRSLGPAAGPPGPARVVTASSDPAYRSADDRVRAEYNDYLWQLAMTDESSATAARETPTPEQAQIDPRSQVPTTIDTAPDGPTRRRRRGR